MLIAVDGGNKNCKQKTGIAMAIVLQKQVNGGHQVLSNKYYSMAYYCLV